MTRRQLLKCVDSQEISEEMALDRINPLPDPWLMVGLLCSTMCNLWSNKKGSGFTPQDFMPIKKQSKAASLFSKLKGAVTKSSVRDKLKQPMEENH
jgi:hypothetical protein